MFFCLELLFWAIGLFACCTHVRDVALKWAHCAAGLFLSVFHVAPSFGAHI